MVKDIIIAVICSSSLTAFITGMLSSIEKKKERNDEIKTALMILMGWDIRKGCKEAIKAKKISFNEFKQLEEMNKVYHQLGGNGYVKALVEKVEHLEVVED